MHYNFLNGQNSCRLMAGYLADVSSLKEEQWLTRAIAGKCIVGKSFEAADGFIIIHGHSLLIDALKK